MRQLERNVAINALGRNPVQHFRVGRARAFRVLARDNVLAKVIQAGGHSGFVASADRFNGGGQFFAGDKALRHAARCFIGSNPALKPGTFGEFEQQRA